MMFHWHEVSDFILQNYETHKKEALEMGMLEYEDVTVDFDYYEAMSRLGRCVVFMRDGDYAVFTFNENPLHFNVMESNNEVFYVKNRKKTKEFIRDAVKEVKRLGAKRVNFMIRNPKVGRFLGFCGLKKTYEVWSA